MWKLYEYGDVHVMSQTTVYLVLTAHATTFYFTELAHRAVTSIVFLIGNRKREKAIEKFQTHIEHTPKTYVMFD